MTEDNMDECEDEHYYDPTLLTFEMEGNVLFKGGLEYLANLQEYVGMPMHMELVKYDVVINVVKRTERRV